MRARPPPSDRTQGEALAFLCASEGRHERHRESAAGELEKRAEVGYSVSDLRLEARGTTSALDHRGVCRAGPGRGPDFAGQVGQGDGRRRRGESVLGGQRHEQHILAQPVAHDSRVTRARSVLVFLGYHCVQLTRLQHRQGRFCFEIVKLAGESGMASGQLAERGYHEPLCRGLEGGHTEAPRRNV